MPKINLNEYEALDQLEEHGARIKTRYKKKRAPKMKFGHPKCLFWAPKISFGYPKYGSRKRRIYSVIRVSEICF